MDAALSAAVIHDLKNALGLLEGELSLLARKKRASASLKSAHWSCARLRLRLMGFLVTYQADTASLVAVERDHDPALFLRGVLEAFSTRRGALVSIAVDPATPPFAFFDERLVELALHAALSNAEAFAERAITIGARPEGGRLVFFVRDDGPGLGPVATPGGTGLGMTVARQAAAAHANGAKRGEVRFSNAPEGGALFEFILP